jgi:3-carboxy-cis,cis-muconate cycloisomerase
VADHRMHAHLALTEGLIVSERLVAALEPLVGRTEARSLLTRASRTAAAADLGLDEALEEEPALAGLLTPKQLRDLLDPTGYLGAAAPLTDRALHRGPAHHHDHSEDLP